MDELLAVYLFRGLRLGCFRLICSLGLAAALFGSVLLLFLGCRSLCNRLFRRLLRLLCRLFYGFFRRFLCLFLYGFFFRLFTILLLGTAALLCSRLG